MSQAPQPEPLVTADEAARHLSISRRHLLDLARDGRIPAHAVSGSSRKQWRFKLSELSASQSQPENFWFTEKERSFKNGASVQRSPRPWSKGKKTMAQFQSGCLRMEARKRGPAVWVYRYYADRETDGKRVERTLVVGTVEELPTKSDARLALERKQLPLIVNQPTDDKDRITFAQLAQTYIRHALGETSGKSHTTIERANQILATRIIPRWGDRTAASIRPLEIMDWLRALQQEEELKNPTLLKIRNTMSAVYRLALQLGEIDCANPARMAICSGESDYQSMILTPEQTFAVLAKMPQPERTLTILIVLTGLRISEALGLKWSDIDFANQRIHIRRTFISGKVQEKTKTKASRAVVPLHAEALAPFLLEWQQQTKYSGTNDWVFASERLKGKLPRVANMLVEDYLRPAAVAAGVLTEDHPRRFGFHVLRHSLASFLVAGEDDERTDPRTAQELLRHAHAATTIGLYSQSMDKNRLKAQQRYSAKIFADAAGVAGVNAGVEENAVSA